MTAGDGALLAPFVMNYFVGLVHRCGADMAKGQTRGFLGGRDEARADGSRGADHRPGHEKGVPPTKGHA